ncbi:MAG: flavin reductase family protein [Burkholderiales bacterium]|nr:flavin reductase family protein [Burkholderiales bacterium]
MSSLRTDAVGQDAAAVDAAQLRRAFGMFATGVTIITAAHPGDGLLGITVNSFHSVSLEPPLVLFSLARTSFTLRPFLETPGFVVNVLREDQRALSHRFARTGDDKWIGVSHRPSELGAPILEGTVASFECTHHAQYDGGDHMIILGRVLRFETDPEGAPLLYFHSRYRRLAEEDER